MGETEQYAGGVATNIAYARAAVRDCLIRGEAPIASHLLFTQPPPTASSEEEFREWNALAAEFDQLWTRCWNGERRSRATLRTVRGAATQARLHRLKMLNALRRVDQTEAVRRALQWQVSRARLALEHDAAQRDSRTEAKPCQPCGFQISESIISAAGSGRRGIGRERPHQGADT